MHFSSFALTALLASTAVASPTWGGEGWKKDWNKKWTDKWNKHDYKNEKVFSFDKTFVVKAVPKQVIAGQGAAAAPSPGEPGAKGLFKFGINVADNTICYNITLSGVTGEYSSPANTATHIHEAAKGANGPPRLAFPNPVGPDERRVSYGCLTGPFKTGIVNNGVDTGANFHVKQIVDNPAAFFADTHTAKFTAGAVRGQLA
ncbi:hypothetical protein N0V90_001959 [Kalmusia sp. IMI 367209]|nr:hypothetical protein N0V90_001959 [Kalmusia sp. IMI 367209]